MALTPIMLILIGQRRFDLFTFVLWFLLCMSDWFDGKLARRYGLSKSGAFLDPLADKLLVLGAMAVLVWKREFSFLPVLLIAAREIAMSVYRSVVGRKGVSVPASRPAKYKTLAQQCCVGFAVMPSVGENARWVAFVLLWVSVALTLYTGAQYLTAARARRN